MLIQFFLRIINWCGLVY